MSKAAECAAEIVAADPKDHVAIITRYYGDNDVVTIHANHPMALFWAVFTTGVLATMLAVAPGWIAVETAQTWLAYLFFAFFPFEILGHLLIMRDKSGVEYAYTESQFLQRIRQEGKGRSRWWEGWAGLASGLCATLGLAAGLAFWAFHPATGVVIGLAVTGFTLPHIHNRGEHG